MVVYYTRLGLSGVYLAVAVDGLGIGDLQQDIRPAPAAQLHLRFPRIPLAISNRIPGDPSFGLNSGPLPAIFCHSSAGAFHIHLPTAVGGYRGDRFLPDFAGQRDFLPAAIHRRAGFPPDRSEEHTSELQSPTNLVCRLLLE